MKKLIKWLSAILGVVILLVVGFILLVDPNQFKPSIESLAKKQGVLLKIDGDLSWKLWPSIGLGLESVSVASAQTPDKQLAKVEQMSLLLAIKPLLSGSFQSDHIVISGLDINLLVDKNGKTNWEFVSENTATDQTTSDASTSALDVNINKISLSNSHLLYQDASAKSRIELSGLDLQLSGVNTKNQVFPLQFAALANIQSASDPAMSLKLDLVNKLQIDESLDTLKISDGELTLELQGKKSVQIPLSYQVSVTGLQKQLAYQGNFSLKSISLRDLLSALDVAIETAEPNALQNFSLASEFAGNDKKIQLDKLDMQLDKTKFTGSIAINDFATSAIKLNLQGDQLNIDHYLPPASEEKTETTSDAGGDEPLPLDALKSLNLNAKLQLAHLVIMELQMQNVNWTILSRNGMLEQDLSAKSYSGKLAFKNQLDARQSPANVKFDLTAEGVEVTPLMNDLFKDRDAEKFDAQGALHLRALGSTSGSSVNQLTNNLQANANFSGAELRVMPLNLEKQFCQLVQLVNKTQSPEQTWDNFTKLTELSGSLKLRDQKIQIDSLKAGVEELLLSSTGVVDLKDDKYNLLLPFKLMKSADAGNTTTLACWSGDTYWLERGMNLLRCKGSLSGVNPLKDCGADKELLLDLTKDYAAYKIKQKHGEKIEAKKQEVKEKVESEKKKLFDKLQKKLGGSSNHADASAQSTETQETTTE